MTFQLPDPITTEEAEAWLGEQLGYAYEDTNFDPYARLFNRKVGPELAKPLPPVLFICGNDGAGKTTLAHLIACQDMSALKTVRILDYPFDGTQSFDKKSINTAKKYIYQTILGALHNDPREVEHKVEWAMSGNLKLLWQAFGKGSLYLVCINTRQMNVLDVALEYGGNNLVFVTPPASNSEVEKIKLEWREHGDVWHRELEYTPGFSAHYQDLREYRWEVQNRIRQEKRAAKQQQVTKTLKFSEGYEPLARAIKILHNPNATRDDVAYAQALVNLANTLLLGEYHRRDLTQAIEKLETAE